MKAKKLLSLLVLLLGITVLSYGQKAVLKSMDLPAKPNLIHHHDLFKYQVLLSEDFSSWPPSGWAFYNANNSPGFIDAGGFAFHNDDRVDCSDYMVSPQLDLPAGSHIIFKFDQYERWSGWYVKHAVLLLDAQDPSTANVIDTLYQGPGTEASWETVVLDLTPYAGQSVYIAFYYEGNYADEWGIDNVLVYVPDSLDLEVQGYTPLNFFANANLTRFSVDFQNIGYSAISDTVRFTVTLASDDTTYVTTYTDSVNLDFGETGTISWTDNWENILPGVYTVTVMLSLPGDTHIENDTIVSPFYVLVPDYSSTPEMTAYVAYDGNTNNSLAGQFVSVAPNGSLTGISEAVFGGFRGMTFSQHFGHLYQMSINYGYLCYVTPDNGMIYATQPIVGVNDTLSILGLAYSLPLDKYYILGVSAYGFSYLYELDPASATATLVGQIGEGIVPVSLTADLDSNLYAIEVVNDALYKIDPVTGEGSQVGTLGMSINYLQDLTYNINNNTLYAALFYYNSNFNTVTAGIYSINTETGMANLLAANQCEITGFAAKFNYKSYVNISVVDDSSNPLDSVMLQFTEDMVMYTDQNGELHSMIDTGTYNLKVIKYGYTILDTVVTIGPDTANFEFTLALLPVYNVTFNVTDGTDPVNGAAIEISLPDNTVVNATTDENGAATVELAEGEYPISVSKGGYLGIDTVINVTSDTTIEITLTYTQISQLEGVSITPNPAYDVVTVSLPESGTIKLIDMNGKVLRSIEVKDSRAVIDVSDLSAGVYMLQVRTAKGFGTYKLIKR